MQPKICILFAAQAASVATQQSRPVLNPDTLVIEPPSQNNQKRQVAPLKERALPTLNPDTLVIEPPSNKKRLVDVGEAQHQPTDPDALIFQSDTKVKRAVCNSDNPLRNLKDQRFSAYASDFCSQFIRPTATRTVYNVVTTRATTTLPASVVTVTNVNIVLGTVTTGTMTVTVAPTLPNTQNQKRDDSVVYPAWLSEYYPFSRISSACSCFISSPSPTLYRTVTAATIAVVLDTKRLPVKSTTITQTTTSIVNITATQTVVGNACGLAGCSNGNYLLEDSDEYPTLADCKAHCMSVDSCMGFQFSVTDHTSCNIASVGAVNLYSNYSTLFPQCQQQSKLYDRNCSV